MPERVYSLSLFLYEITRLLRLISRCSPVLFRREFRDALESPIEETIKRLEEFLDHEFVRNPDEFEDMRNAGLTGPQLDFKLDSFESALNAFDEEGGQDRLEETLDKGSTILRSVAGAIPGFGSFANELLDFLLIELKKRFRFWSR